MNETPSPEVIAWLKGVGAKGGKKTSAAKAAAARANGLKSKGAPKGNQNWRGKAKAIEKAPE